MPAGPPTATPTYEQPCTLPVSFAEGLQPSSGPDGCADSTVLRPRQACSVECAAAWVPVSGTTSFQCHSGGNLSVPTLKCLYNPCRLPIAFSEGVEGLTCIQGGYIGRGQRCKVQCSIGYQVLVDSSTTGIATNEYFCDFNRLVDASLRCVASTL